MARDPRKLEAFVLADQLVLDVYRVRFPVDERFGLQSQIRRGAISVVANLVEGSTRRSERDYLHFVTIAIGSASEVRYLIDVASRLGFVEAGPAQDLGQRYDRVIRALQALISFLRKSEVRSPKSEVRP